MISHMHSSCWCRGGSAGASRGGACWQISLFFEAHIFCAVFIGIEIIFCCYPPRRGVGFTTPKSTFVPSGATYCVVAVRLNQVSFFCGVRGVVHQRRACGVVLTHRGRGTMVSREIGYSAAFFWRAHKLPSGSSSGGGMLCYFFVSGFRFGQLAAPWNGMFLY